MATHIMLFKILHAKCGTCLHFFCSPANKLSKLNQLYSALKITHKFITKTNDDVC